MPSHCKMKWTSAVKRARKELGLKGFVPIKKGSKLYNTAKKYHKPGCGKSRRKSKRRSRRRSRRRSKSRSLRRYRKKHSRMDEELASDILADARRGGCKKGRLKTPRRQANGKFRVCRKRRSRRRSRSRSRKRRSRRRSRSRSRKRR